VLGAHVRSAARSIASAAAIAHIGCALVLSAGVLGSDFISGEIGNRHLAVGAGGDGVCALAAPEQLSTGASRVTGPEYAAALPS
jgi:hypothetical protein